MDRLLIGTRFEEDELKQKQNFYNQKYLLFLSQIHSVSNKSTNFKKAVNEKGHKRFHGAFTGGFSAGYKGTVGSEEGFIPKSFTSSRQQRIQNGGQSIQDYMDEEDLGTHVIGANLTTKDEYDTFANVSETIQAKQFGANFFGKVPTELIVEQRKTVGWEILNNIQFKRKKKDQILKSIQEKTLAQYLEGEELNIEDFEVDEHNNNYNKDKFDSMENYKIKNDFQGIGFKGKQENDDIDEFAEEEFNRLIKRSYMTQEEIEEEQAKKKENNRIYTNFKKDYNYDDDDEDEVFTDQPKKIIEYEQQEVTKKADSQKMIKHTYLQMKGLNIIFVKDQKILQIETKPNQIKVPDDYNPYKRMQDYIKSGGKIIEFQKQKKKIQRLNAVQRKAILEGQQEMDKIKEQIETKRFVKAKEEEETEEIKNETFKSWDAQKQQRYYNWVQEKEGKGIYIEVAQLMSYKEMKTEQKDFSKVFKEINEKGKQKTVLDKIDDLQKKIDEIKNFRTCQPFFPDKLLCKRFGVLPPYKDKEYFDKKMEEYKRLQDKDNLLQTKVFVKGGSQQESEYDPSSLGLPVEFKSNKYGLISYKKDENDMDLDNDDEEQDSNKLHSKNKHNNKGQQEDIYDVGKSFQQKKIQRDFQIQENQKLIEEIEQDKKEIFKEKPPIQLFKSIFGDDEDQDESED